MARMDEAERLLGPAYWDDGDSRSMQTLVTRMIARPDRYYSPLATRPHDIFGRWPEIQGQYAGGLYIGGALHKVLQPISDATIRSYQVLHPWTRDAYQPWRIGTYVQHAHDERSVLEDGRAARRVDTVSAQITMAAQVLRWSDRWWWLLIRDLGGLTLLQRPIAGGAWRHRPDVLEAMDMLGMRLPRLDEIEL